MLVVSSFRCGSFFCLDVLVVQLLLFRKCSRVYNAVMANSGEHSRRDFLQGRAAARTLVDKAQAWVDASSELLGVDSTSSGDLHLHASRWAMACEFAVQFHQQDQGAAEAMLEGLDLIEQLEAQMTIYRDTSEVIEINRNAAKMPVQVEPRLFEVLELANRLHLATDGAFDITSSPLSRTWGFLSREGRFPGDEEIAAALDRVGGNKVQLDSEQRTIRFLESGSEINLNSIGKGYALDRVADQLDRQHVTDYLWHGGGSSVLSRGCNRDDRHQAWTLGLRHPLQPEHRIGELHLRNQGLATAGSGTQFFEYRGRRLSHIIDPRTGWPVEGMLTATALAPSAAEADALATAFFVMGPEAVEAYCAANTEIGAVLVCAGKVPAGIAIHAFGMPPDSWTLLLNR